MIAPSILAADFARLGEEADAVDDADWLHVDMMDAHFVPNLTIGLPVVESLQKATDLPLDCHLMIDDPDRWAPGYAEAGAANVTFHVEAAADAVPPRARSARPASLAGLARRPGHPARAVPRPAARVRHAAGDDDQGRLRRPGVHPEVLDKVRLAREHVAPGTCGCSSRSTAASPTDTIEAAAEAGADVFVAGTAVYGADDPAGAVEALRARARAAMNV